MRPNAVSALGVSLCFAVGVGIAMLVGRGANRWVALGVLPLTALALLATSALARQREPSPTLAALNIASKAAWKRARRAVVLVVGLTILALSIPIGLLPGPGGIAVALGGLALLATEFVWARKLMRRATDAAGSLRRAAQHSAQRRPRPWLVPVIGAALAGITALACTQQDLVPARTVLLFAIGPTLAWGFWSYLTLAAWRANARRDRARDSQVPSDCA